MADLRTIMNVAVVIIVVGAATMLVFGGGMIGIQLAMRYFGL